jgi:hypothetical protein
MTDDNLDAEPRREFDAIFVPYDAARAQHMIDCATCATGAICATCATQDVLTGGRT